MNYTGKIKHTVCQKVDTGNQGDGQYAAFGKVVAGMDVVDQIAAVRTDWNDKPTTPVKMKTVELIEG